jgi:type VI secretion system secreted protein Hcp
MSSHCFLRLKGISGEASDADHQDEIQVKAWDWGVSAADGLPGGKSRGDTRKLVVTHTVDAASPALMVYCVRGTMIPNAVLTMRKASGDRPMTYFTAKLDRVRVVDVTTSLHSDGGTTEVVSLAFEKVEVTYTPQTGTGGQSGALTQQWDVKEGQR